MTKEDIKDWDWTDENQDIMKLQVGDEMTREYAEIMANTVLTTTDCAGFCAGPDAEWDAYRSEDDDNVVVFSCDGNSYEYEFKDKEDLTNIIYDFFKEFEEF